MNIIKAIQQKIVANKFRKIEIALQKPLVKIRDISGVRFTQSPATNTLKVHISVDDPRQKTPRLLKSIKSTLDSILTEVTEGFAYKESSISSGYEITIKI